ncbi:MAG: DUF4905 domain-containing protein [Bacteroidota bacterium]
MKIKNKYSYTDGNQVWRIKLTETDKLFIETRNTEKKEAFFHCLHLNDGKPIFTQLQMEEKYWLGIETIYKDIILFHKFAKPDMPGHKGIFAFDINTQNVLWENEEYAFLFLLDKKIYAYQEKFEGKKVSTLSVETGELIEDLGNNPPNINNLKDLADSQIDYTDYKFPESYYGTTTNPVNDELINSEIKNLSITGNIEFLHFVNFLIFNYHSQSKNKGITNNLVVFDTLKKKIIFKEILNTHLNAFAPDSFFIYKNLLILIKEKNQVFVYDLIE